MAHNIIYQPFCTQEIAPFLQGRLLVMRMDWSSTFNKASISPIRGCRPRIGPRQ